MKVLVIIVSYNFERWIDRCLDSLRGSEHPVDTLVVDNGSKDRTVEIIRNNYPEVRLIESGANLGFGRANNTGMQIALREGYDYVFLLNQDAWIDPHVIGTLTGLSQDHPEYGILSPVHLTGSGDKPDPGFGHYAGIGQIADLRPAEPVISLPFINAAFWMIPVPVLRSIGGFSPLFYHYGEDKDYVNRIAYHRYRVGYVPTVFGCHDRENRTVGREAFLHSEQIHFLTEYANINHSLPAALAYGVLASFKKALKALLRKDTQAAAAYTAIPFRLLRKTFEVSAYRKKNKKKHSNYLQS